MSELLPPATSALERSAASACADATALPSPLRELWNADTCPAALLPYLAWAWSVDRWDPAWSESSKRNVVAASYFVHQHKGTIGALRRVVEPLGYIIDVVEWFEQMPEGVPGTFGVNVGVLETGITEAMHIELERLITDAKPMTRHLSNITITLQTGGALYVGAAAVLGDETTIYPYAPAPIEIASALHAAGAEHSIDTMSIYP